MTISPICARDGASGSRLLPLSRRVAELEGLVEIVDQSRFAAASDEDQLLDSRLARLVNRILDQWAVDDRDHLLGDALGGGEQAGAEAGDGEDRLADAIGHLFSRR